MNAAVDHRRILIIDDSAYSRRALKRMLEELEPTAEILYASSGDEGLQIALSQRPDVVFTDLEMPRMDGFTLLRILMARNPLPVIIISGRDDENSILKAMELGALDFIGKPTQQTSTRIYEIKDELQEKLELTRAARFTRTEPVAPDRAVQRPVPQKTVPSVHAEPTQLIVIGASTGGPGTVSFVLQNLNIQPWTTILIVQHMPPVFTTAFADRLNRIHPFPVQEIRNLDRIDAGTVYVCPGGNNVVVSRGRDLRFRLMEPDESDRYVPNIDRSMTSGAAEFGGQCLGLVLTGMGNDGTAGSRAIREAGGNVLVEDPGSAIVFGMPAAVVEAGLAHAVYPLDAVPGALEQWMLGILSRGDKVETP